MNWLDIVLLVIVFVSAFTGLRKGLSRELIGLAASVLSLILAFWFYHSAATHLAPYVSQQWAASLGGFLIIFFGVLLIGGLLSMVVSTLLKTVGLSPIDRLLGAAYGVARGALFSFGLLTVLVAFLPSADRGQLPKAVLQSRMAPYLIELSWVITPLAPKSLRESFHQQYRQVKSTWTKKAES